MDRLMNLSSDLRRIARYAVPPGSKASPIIHNGSGGSGRLVDISARPTIFSGKDLTIRNLFSTVLTLYLHGIIYGSAVHSPRTCIHLGC
jgi:hypothetical protein